MNSHKLWCPPKYVLLSLFNYSSLHYKLLYLTLSLPCPSAVTDLSNKTSSSLQNRHYFFVYYRQAKAIVKWARSATCMMGEKHFFYALPCHTCLVFLTRLKREKKRHFMQANRKQKVQMNPTVSILVRELTVFFHNNLKLKSQPFSVFDLESIFNTLACVSPPSLKWTLYIYPYIMPVINCVLFLVFSHCK